MKPILMMAQAKKTRGLSTTTAIRHPNAIQVSRVTGTGRSIGACRTSAHRSKVTHFALVGMALLATGSFLACDLVAAPSTSDEASAPVESGEAVPRVDTSKGAGPAETGRTGSPALVFVNGLWFDGKAFVARSFYSVNGTLQSEKPSRVDLEVDLGGGFVVPPYGEAHNHNAGMASGRDITNRYLREGIFYVKNPANLVRNRAAEGVVNVPHSIDVAYANGVFTAPGGHPIGLVRRNIARGVMTEKDGEGAFFHTVQSEADVEAKWPMALARRPDFIKTLLLYSEEHEKRRDDEAYFAWKGLDPALLPVIVRKAHDGGLRVSTHVETAADFRAAAAAGVDEINHLPGFRPERGDPTSYGDLERYAVTDVDAALAARQGIVVVTTVSGLLDHLAALDPAAPEKRLADEVRAMVVRNLEVLRRHGVKIAIGSDRYEMTATAEAMALQRLGVFDNLTLLKVWSETTPETIFPKRKLGKLDDGYEASFLVLEADPLSDFANTGKIRKRVKQGLVLPEPAS